MKLIAFSTILFAFFILANCQSTRSTELPKKGLCAHRGAMDICPENTLPAFREAVKAGAHMIEFDVWLTKDHQMVIIHDSKVDRTTNGHGKVSDLTIDEIRKLDAGSWKDPRFAGVRIPTPQEVLKEMPYNVWINIHIKADGDLPVMLARLLEKQGRLHQAFLACSTAAARQAKEAVPGIKICNMERLEPVENYIEGTIGAKADFIQLLRKSEYKDFAADVKRLKDHGIRINYFYAQTPSELKMLFETGVDFPLVNNLSQMIGVARELGIEPVKPIFKREN